MALPKLKKCCGCLPLLKGGVLLTIFSTMLCVANIVAGSWNLPHFARPEDNFISMSMVMFSTLSAIGNIVVLLGVLLRRPGFLQLSLLFNSVFILCIFLVAVTTILFSPQFSERLQQPANLAIGITALIIGAVYSIYYMIVVNSLYRLLKTINDSAIPV